MTESRTLDILTLPSAFPPGGARNLLVPCASQGELSLFWASPQRGASSATPPMMNRTSSTMTSSALRATVLRAVVQPSPAPSWCLCPVVVPCPDYRPGSHRPSNRDRDLALGSARDFGLGLGFKLASQFGLQVAGIGKGGSEKATRRNATESQRELGRPGFEAVTYAEPAP